MPFPCGCDERMPPQRKTQDPPNDGTGEGNSPPAAGTTVSVRPDETKTSPATVTGRSNAACRIGPPLSPRGHVSARTRLLRQPGRARASRCGRRGRQRIRGQTRTIEESNHAGTRYRKKDQEQRVVPCHRRMLRVGGLRAVQHQDRKSTRLNSSHVKISYAVF